MNLIEGFALSLGGAVVFGLVNLIKKWWDLEGPALLWVTYFLSMATAIVSVAIFHREGLASGQEAICAARIFRQIKFHIMKVCLHHPQNPDRFPNNLRADTIPWQHGYGKSGFHTCHFRTRTTQSSFSSAGGWPSPTFLPADTSFTLPS